MHTVGITHAPWLPILNLPVPPQSLMVFVLLTPLTPAQEVAGSLLSTMQDSTGVAVPEADGGGKRIINQMPGFKNIAELRVNHHNRNAESGAGGAGQLNVNTKSGTCDFLASACESFCNDLWLR